MKQKQIDLFFELLDQELGLAAEIILVGASAASLMGHVRPSLDIDFEIRFKGSKTSKTRAKLEAALAKAQTLAGVAVNYSENISGWSMVDYLDYRKTATPYKKVGKLNVKIVAPEYWTIGKMTRFLELDIQDMIKIIRTKKIKAKPLIALWARALKASDLSLELGQFREHVIFFVQRYGKKLWGKKVDPEVLLKDFKNAV